MHCPIDICRKEKRMPIVSVLLKVRSWKVAPMRV